MQEMGAGLAEMGMRTNDDPYLEPAMRYGNAERDSRDSDSRHRADANYHDANYDASYNANYDANYSTDYNEGRDDPHGTQNRRALPDAQGTNAGRSEGRSERINGTTNGALMVFSSANLVPPEQRQLRLFQPKSVKHGVDYSSLNSGQNGAQNAREQGITTACGKYCVDLSDRNLLCSAVNTNSSNSRNGSNLVVFGSADHGLKEVDAFSGRITRKFFARSGGHSDWVTCVTYSNGAGADNSVVSGGADGRVCVWTGSGNACTTLGDNGGSGNSGSLNSNNSNGGDAHRGSISQLEMLDSSTVLSASYDKSLRVWSTNGGKRSTQSAKLILKGHTAPILR